MSRSPVVVDPADIPDDAAGRVDVIAIRAPADVIDPGEVQIPDAPPRASPLLAAVTLYDGWLVVALIAALLGIIFVIGMVLTH